MNVAVVPTKTYRLGKYNPEETGPRPLKLEFENKESTSQVMGSVRALRNAPDNIKNISLCYDLSKEDRALTKKKVAEAKELTKNDQEYVHKVRALPGDVEIIRFRKQAE